MPASVREPSWPTELAQTVSGAPQAIPERLTLAVLPDTQYYASCRSPHLESQARFLRENAGSRNIAVVLTLGDLTDHNSPAEWEFFRDTMRPLHSTQPLIYTLGNHDYGKEGSADHRTTLFGQFFAREKLASQGALTAAFQAGHIENAYYRFRVQKDPSGQLESFPAGAEAHRASENEFYLGVLTLEWSPRATTIEWARQTLAAFPEDQRILTVHAYLYNDDTRYDLSARGEGQRWNPRTYGIESNEDHTGHDGEMLWRALVEPDPGFFLVLSGHVLGDGAGRLVSTNSSGHSVHQLLVNYQMLREGGLGYLRLLELAPSTDRIWAHTYSPSNNLSSLAPDQDFQLDLGRRLMKR
jgi:hypothetical protein